MKELLTKPSWKMRRRVVFFTLIFSATLIAYVTYKWDSTSLAENLVIGAFGLMGAVIAAYIGGAAYEDVRTYRTDSEYVTDNYSNQESNSEEGME